MLVGRRDTACRQRVGSNTAADDTRRAGAAGLVVDSRTWLRRAIDQFPTAGDPRTRELACLDVA